MSFKLKFWFSVSHLILLTVGKMFDRMLMLEHKKHKKIQPLQQKNQH
jgi:hypothetical protein